MLRVRVITTSTGELKTDVTFPSGVVRAALRYAPRFARELAGMDISEVARALEQGRTGKVAEFVLPGEDETVEVYIE